MALRELAKRQGITEGALYKHFDSKEEILLAVFDYYARYDTKIMNTIQNSNMTPKESIGFFVSSIAETCESHPASTCIVNSYEVLTEDTTPVRRVKEIFNTRSNYLTSLIEKGQNDGSIIGGFCGEYLSDMIIGLLRATVIKWRMSGFKFHLKARAVSSLELLLSRF